MNRPGTAPVGLAWAVMVTWLAAVLSSVAFGRIPHVLYTGVIEGGPVAPWRPAP